MVDYKDTNQLDYKPPPSHEAYVSSSPLDLVFCLIAKKAEDHHLRILYKVLSIVWIRKRYKLYTLRFISLCDLDK